MDFWHGTLVRGGSAFAGECIMFKKDDFVLEYVYRKRQFRRAMWIYLAVFIALRVLRAVLYFTVGVTFLASIPAAFIFWGTGFVCGLALLTLIIYRRSVRVDELIEEADRLKK